MTAPRLSRRSLFGLGLGRVVRERLDALDHSETGPGEPPESDGAKRARRKEAALRTWGEGDYRPLAARLEPAAARLLEVCGTGMGRRVLDVGAGDGNLALEAARAGAQVTAIDLSPVLVERGRERTRGSGLEVEWHEADVEALPFEDASFDCVASNFGVIHAEDPRQAVAELERVLRPGGMLVLTAWTSSGVMARILRLGADRAGGASVDARPERWGRYETAFLHLSRFDDFDMHDARLTMAFDEEEELWSVLSRPPGPLAGALRAGADPVALRGELLGLVAGHHRERAIGPRLDVSYAILTGRKQAWAVPAPGGPPGASANVAAGTTPLAGS